MYLNLDLTNQGIWVELTQNSIGQAGKEMSGIIFPTMERLL